MEAQEKQPKETDAIKSKLAHYAGFQRLIDNQIARLETLAASMGSPASPNLTGMPAGGGDGSSKQERQVLRKIELEEKIRGMIAEEAEIRAQIVELVEQLENPDERTVIELRYLDHQNWWSVSTTIFGEEADYDEHEKRYLKRTFKIHGSALQSLARIENNQKSE
jgi:hypothetical protein